MWNTVERFLLSILLSLSLCACVWLRKRSDGKREQVQVQGWRERGIRMMRSVLVSVGFGLLLHGAVVFVVTSFTPGLSIMRVPAPFLSSPLLLSFPHACFACALV